jgi:tetratricopeptide (TPR) repeat protein
MERPEQHIIETKSLRIFENIVPVEWVCRELKPDYGVDYLIEIFENNKSTGKTFFVQLKGSSQKIVNDTFEKQFTVNNLDYYKSLSLPVLIVCVSVNTKQIWAIWANNFLDSKKIKDKQKNISISLGKKYLIDEDLLTRLAFEPNTSDKIGVSIEAESEIGKAFIEHLSKWINNYYKENVSIEFKNLPEHIKLLCKTDDDQNLSIEISTPFFSKRIEIGLLPEDESFLFKPLFDCKDVNQYNKKALLFIALALAKYNIKSSLEIIAKVISEIELEPKDFKVFDPVGLLSLAKTNKDIGLFNELVDNIIDLKRFDLFFFFDLAYFAFASKEFQSYRISNLTKIIENNDDEPLLGTCYYNLGNIYKSDSNTDKALSAYFLTRKYQPDYLNRNYWWREFAGLVFVKQHYSWAENFYKKSLELTKNAGVGERYNRMIIVTPEEKYLELALIADCLFFQSKFKEANVFFEKYFKASNSNSQEWILKNMICLELMDSELDSVKVDNILSIQLCEEAIKIQSNEDCIAKLNESIHQNPTNGLAWFNLGVSQDKVGKHEEAMFSFIFTGLLQEWDKEAQFNALTISFTTQKLDIMQAILLFLYQKHGDLILNDLSAYIMKKNMPLDGKRHFIKAFEKMFEIVKTIHNNVYTK